MIGARLPSNSAAFVDQPSRRRGTTLERHAGCVERSDQIAQATQLSGGIIAYGIRADSDVNVFSDPAAVRPAQSSLCRSFT